MNDNLISIIFGIIMSIIISNIIQKNNIQIVYL